MLRLIEDGLLSAGSSKTPAFKMINFDANNKNNGTTMFRKVMIVKVEQNPAADETFGIGSKTYTFKASSAAGAQINIGTTIAETSANIAAKINLDTLDTRCTAYVIGNGIKILLVENIAGTIVPTFTADGAKVASDTTWSTSIAEAKLESTSYFKVSASDGITKPVVLSERNACTANNFLY